MTINRLRTIKRGLCLSLCIALLLTALLAACTVQKTDVDLQALRQELLAATTLPEMKSVSSTDDNAERNLQSITDIAYDKVAEYTIDYAADGAAYEIAVIRLRSESDTAELTKSLQKHIKSRTEQYRFYMPEQVPNAEAAIIAENGPYIALIMCDDPAAVEAAFDKAFI